MYDQEHQWSILEEWYMDNNPHKLFDTFLQIRGFPNNQFEEKGLYYLQICRKFWHASRKADPLEWVIKMRLQSRLYDEKDAEPSTHRFIHEGELHYYLKKAELNINDFINSMGLLTTVVFVTTLSINLFTR
jgi:hypothetical protein